MAEGDRNGGGNLVSTLMTAVTSVPAAVGALAVGTGAFFGRHLVRLLSGPASPMPPDPPATHPNAARIRESAKAAERAARASGLLRPRERR